jgi:hypothetical protein
MSRTTLRLAAALSLIWALAPAPASAEETPSEKIRKALDQPIDLDLKENSLAQVAERFREKTKLDITIDRSGAFWGIGFALDPNAALPQPIEAKFKHTKARDALRKVFEPYGLMPFIVDDAVLLTGEDAGISKQLKQRVDVDLADVPLAAALKQLGRRKAINLVVDQKSAKQAEKKVSLQVDDVALETAVRLLAEQAGMKAARIDNVLYVTTPEQAASIAADNRAFLQTYGPYGPLFNNATGGVGVLGAWGAIGLAGGGGAIGLGGGGGIVGGPPRLVPPPAPPKEDSKPAPPAEGSKPLGRAPSRAASVAAALPFPPVERPELWAREVGRSSVGTRRRRRRVEV